MSPSITTWTVTIPPDRPALFDRLDTALEYLRGYLATNGSHPSQRVILECGRMDSLRYAAEVELEDGAAPGDALVSRS